LIVLHNNLYMAMYVMSRSSVSMAPFCFSVCDYITNSQSCWQYLLHHHCFQANCV